MLFGLALLMLAACEKPIMDYDEKIGHEEDANVTLRFLPNLQDGFGTRGAALADQLTRLSVAIFRQDGTKVKSINQQQDDADFGRVDVLLEPGTYRVVAVAHNSTEGSATISSTEKVTFANNKMSDTFSCCEVIEIGDEHVDMELLLQRVVAMVRLTITGGIPDNVAMLKFYYTGGSSTLNPRTGYGCVQSKQTEYRPTIAVDGQPVSVYEIYTVPHEQNDVLKLVITAQDASSQTIDEWTMENIPITRNKITTWTGTLFSGGGGTGGGTGSGGINIALDTQWDGTINYTW